MNNNSFVTGTLIGVDSNALSLMAHFKGLATDQGLSSEWINEVLTDAMSGDYVHLLKVLNSHMREK